MATVVNKLISLTNPWDAFSTHAQPNKFEQLKNAAQLEASSGKNKNKNKSKNKNKKKKKNPDFEEKQETSAQKPASASSSTPPLPGGPDQPWIWETWNTQPKEEEWQEVAPKKGKIKSDTPSESEVAGDG